MTRLYRPRVPMRIQALVAERQLLMRGTPPQRFENGTCWKRRRDLALAEMFGSALVHLDHDPALCNRVRRETRGTIRYEPEANDPSYLVWRTAAEHDIKTRVRGEHGQHSDLALARKRRRIEKKRSRASKGTRWRGFRSTKDSQR